MNKIIFILAGIVFLSGCGKEQYDINEQYDILVGNSQQQGKRTLSKIETSHEDCFTWKNNGVLTLKNVKLIGFRSSWQNIKDPVLLDAKPVYEVKDGDVIKIGSADTPGRIFQFTCYNYIFSILICKDFYCMEIGGWKSLNDNFISFYNRNSPSTLYETSAFYTKYMCKRDVYIEKFRLGCDASKHYDYDSIKVYRNRQGSICIKFDILKN